MSDLSLLEWLQEHEQDALTIAKTKRGDDRAGWIEDARYFSRAQQAASALGEALEHVEALKKELFIKHAWKQQAAQAEATAKAIGEQLEADRSAVSDGVTAITKAINSRFWLTEGRGSYEWDDERYRDEFGAAVKEIQAALEPLARIAMDWAGCPRNSDEVAQARIDLKAVVETLKWAIKAKDKQLAEFSDALMETRLKVAPKEGEV